MCALPSISLNLFFWIPSICLRCFLGIGSLSEVLAWCQKSMWSCTWQSWMFLRKILCLKYAENEQKMDQVEGSLNLLKTCCLTMKVYIYAVGLEKFHIWENFGSWIVDQNAFSQSNCRIFKSTIYSEKINEIAWFFDVDTNSRKLKVDCKSFDFWCQGSIAVVLCSVVI